jgi:hypothetical protein
LNGVARLGRKAVTRRCHVSSEGAGQTEPPAARDLKDEIVAMFEEALARNFEPGEAPDPEAAVKDT